MTKRIWLALLCLSLAVFTMAFAACGDDDDDGGGSEEDIAEIIDTTTTLANTNGAEATDEEVAFYMAHVTDEFIQAFGTFQTVEECEAAAAECIGEPLPNATVTAENIEIDGDEADVAVQSEIGPFGIEVTKNDEDVWQASGVYVPDDELAEDVEVVDLGMDEFAFEGDFESDAVKSGDFAFHATNNGEQVHEVVLVELPAEGTIEELLQDESFQPEPIFVKYGYGEGDESDIALSEPLAAGRYGLVCFLPDTSEDVPPEEQTPHAFLGMTAEFTVE